MADGNKKKKYIVFLLQLVAAAVLALVDQLIKKAAVTSLKGQDGIVLIKNVLGLTYAENTGAAFSAFSDSTITLSVVTLLMLVAVVAFLFFAKISNKAVNVGVTMILGGGVGNLIDRFAQGYVVDYIETLFVDFPVYNFADICVTVGVAIVCVCLIYDMIKEEKQKKNAKEEAAHGDHSDA